MGGLYHPEDVQKDEYQSNNDQNMDPITQARQLWTQTPAKKTEQPQDD